MEQTSDTTPYNPHNIPLDTPSLDSILHIYDNTDDNKRHVYFDLNLYRNAMVHRSYCTRKNENLLNGNVSCPKNCIPLQEESFERLEFLGDAVINLIIGKYLFERYPDENEGFLTKLRTKLVNGIMLANFCVFAKIPPYILISKQIEESAGRSNKKLLEDCFEAFVGAMFMDLSNNNNSAYPIVEMWIIALLEQNVDLTDLINTNTNYKDMFLKYYQHNYNYNAKFYEINTEIINNQKMHVVCVKDMNGSIIATGKGSSKKSAENNAAFNALKYFGVGNGYGISIQ